MHLVLGVTVLWLTCDWVCLDVVYSIKKLTFRWILIIFRFIEISEIGL